LQNQNLCTGTAGITVLLLNGAQFETNCIANGGNFGGFNIFVNGTQYGQVSWQNRDMPKSQYIFRFRINSSSPWYYQAFNQGEFGVINFPQDNLT